MRCPPTPSHDAVVDGPGGWHVDDLVQFSLPSDIQCHGPNVPLPCNMTQLFTPVIRIGSVAWGPTQLVSQRHYAGLRPEIQDRPNFDGNGPVSILTEPADAYIFNNQVWHRGAPNTSDRRRRWAGATYSKRFISKRFYPFVDYRMPEHVWEGTGPRLQRMLGRHRHGSYG